ncbi:peptidylprolyl isomerase [Brasilonema octagenarum UFV-E1]|uniref:peptidylprolyl isomerase n=2 Tax=Brasilonema TaxID=383614 RepID=A0A856MKE2_9CYAN|nr:MULTISPECIES: peptidylprolyl isomerase [Brasilonema]NMF63965.1 peptidylprolyl isomerase [Brasilonema octagenarum UFV-OR1]QDL10604.1 peptidylprolyl isomerase [Brasilonema sennae CENA114]QDL16947.1 peptidylprolyl isomerase [Brasilonema octagenarum UFV-E1]
MSPTITVTNEEILEQVKLTCKIPEITEAIMTRKFIERTVVEVGIKVETEELQKAADQFRLVYQLQSAEETWKWLDKYSLSLDDLEHIAYTNLISGKLAIHLFENKVEPYFFEHYLDYFGVAMYEVILDDEDLAIELFYAIQEGEMSFSDVAHKYIQNTELRRKGGYRGVVRRKDLKPEVSTAVFAVKSPQLLKPILTSKGVHLIFVEELIQPTLDDKLRTNILSDLFSEWLRQEVQKDKAI